MGGFSRMSLSTLSRIRRFVLCYYLSLLLLYMWLLLILSCLVLSIGLVVVCVFVDIFDVIIIMWCLIGYDGEDVYDCFLNPPTINRTTIYLHVSSHKMPYYYDQYHCY